MIKFVSEKYFNEVIVMFEFPAWLLKEKEEIESKISEMDIKIQEEYNQIEINKHIYDRTQNGLFIIRDKFNEINTISLRFNEKVEKWQRMQYVASKFNNLFCN